MKSPFPVHPVNLTTRQLEQYGPEIERIGREIYEGSAQSIHPPRHMATLDDVIPHAYDIWGRMWFTPMVILFFQEQQPFSFGVPGDLKAWAPIVRQFIDKMNPLCVVVAIPDRKKIVVYMQHGEFRGIKKRRTFDAPFELGWVSGDIHRMYSAPYDLPRPTPSQVAETTKFTNFLEKNAPARDGFNYTKDI